MWEDVDQQGWIKSKLAWRCTQDRHGDGNAWAQPGRSRPNGPFSSQTLFQQISSRHSSINSSERPRKIRAATGGRFSSVEQRRAMPEEVEELTESQKLQRAIAAKHKANTEKVLRERQELEAKKEAAAAAKKKKEDEEWAKAKEACAARAEARAAAEQKVKRSPAEIVLQSIEQLALRAAEAEVKQSRADPCVTSRPARSRPRSGRRWFWPGRGRGLLQRP